MDKIKTTGLPRCRCQRIRDVVLAVGVLFVIWPLLMVLALIVVVLSGFPVFYLQHRVGRHGRLFTIYKFRTLRVGNPSHGHITPEDDERITLPGLWLRRWRLDELPSIVNILRGEMTLVGPRPMPQEHAAVIPKAALSRLLSVPPGITGRSGLDFLAEDACLAGLDEPEKAFNEKLSPAKVACELAYLDDPNPWKDWLILFESVFTVLSPKAREKSARMVNNLLNSQVASSSQCADVEDAG